MDEANNAIYVYRAEAPETPTQYGIEGLIDCEPLLPNWQRRVVDIFADQTSAEAVAGEVAEEWREEGATQRSLEMAQTMLNDGLDPAIIAKYSGLAVAQVAALQDPQQ